MKTFTSLTATLLVAALGCSDTTTGGGGGGGALTIDGFASAYYGALCASLFQCPAAGDNGSTAALFENPTLCAERAARFAYPSVNDLVGFVRAGSIRFDGAAARTCLDQVTAACVTTDTDLQRVCRRAFTGTVAVGGGCWRSEQCAPGNFCDHTATTARACPGACRAQVGVGAMCNTDRQCLGWSDGTAACTSGRCATLRTGTPAAEGQRCGDIENADMTVTRTACAANLGCRSGMCRRIVAAGAPCVAAMDVCAAGTFCAQRPGTTGTTCTPGADLIRSTPGGTCNPTPGRPVICNPTARLTCNAMMTCESLGNGAMGSRCTPGGDLNATTCNEGLRCDPTSSTCVARFATGAMCQRDADCLSGECEDSRCLEHVCE
jgi:hypothetical protein